MPKYLFILLLIAIGDSSIGQLVFHPIKVRKSILLLTNSFPIYQDTAFPKYLQNTYDTVFKKATVTELYELTNHSNPCVRRSAFYSLLDRNSPKILSLLKKNASDTIQWFFVQYGCLEEQQTFVDEMLFYLSPRSGWDRNFKMTPAQKELVVIMTSKRENERQKYFFNQ